MPVVSSSLRSTTSRGKSAQMDATMRAAMSASRCDSLDIRLWSGGGRGEAWNVREIPGESQRAACSFFVTRQLRDERLSPRKAHRVAQARHELDADVRPIQVRGGIKEMYLERE